jgi:hypothetical protein
VIARDVRGLGAAAGDAFDPRAPSADGWMPMPTSSTVSCSPSASRVSAIAIAEHGAVGGGHRRLDPECSCRR